MFFYLALACVPLIIEPIFGKIYAVSPNENKKVKKDFLIVCGIFLFLMIALRHYSVGSNDSLHYYDHWKKLQQINSPTAFWRNLISSDMEKGYLLSVWLLSRVFVSPQWIFVFSGLLFSVSVCLFLYRNSEDVALSFVLFVCLGLYEFMVQGLRQAIAMSICLFALEFCKRRKLFPFLLLVFLAMLFHRSAIVFIIIYFFYGSKFNIKTGAVVGAVGVVLFGFSNTINSLGNSFFGREYEGGVETGGFVAVLIYVLILVLALFFTDAKQKNSNDFVFFIVMTLFGAYFYMMRYFENLIIERISFYFMFGQLILLPNVVNSLQKERRVLKLLAVFLSMALFVYRNMNSSLTPYLFFWQ